MMVPLSAHEIMHFRETVANNGFDALFTITVLQFVTFKAFSVLFRF